MRLNERDKAEGRYWSRYEPRVARLRLAQAVENQFDTTVVAAFEAILATSDDAYRTAQRDDFRPGQPSSSVELDFGKTAVDAA